MTDLGLIFVIAVAAALIIAIVLYTNKTIKIKKYLQQIEELERKRTVIYGNSITHEFNKLKKMNISKESEVQVIELEKATEEVFQGRIKELSDILYDLEDQVSDRDLSGVNEKITEIENEINLLEHKTKELSMQVKAIVAQEEAAAVMHADLKEKVNTDLKLINSYKNKLGEELYTAFYKRWETINAMLDEYLQLNIVNDRERADEIVRDVNAMTQDTQNYLYYIPQTHEFIHDTLQPKLDKVVREATKLIEKGYIFSQDNLLDTLGEIQILINGIEKDLVEFISKDFQEEFDVTIAFLNQVEREIETELRSHSELPSKLAKIDEYSNEIKLQFNEFKNQKQSYVKHGVDASFVASMDELVTRFDDILSDNQILHHAFKNPETPFSELLNETKKQLKIIADFRADVESKSRILKSKIKEEKEIIKLLEGQKEKLNRGIVAIEAARMPAIPEWYYIERDEIKKIFITFDTKLGTGNYTIPELIEMVNDVKTKVDLLTDRIGNLIEYFNLAKDTIIYLNRFLDSDQARIVKAKAVNYFQEGEFKKSANTINEFLQTTRGV